jgi:hypothetical protein
VNRQGERRVESVEALVVRAVAGDDAGEVTAAAVCTLCGGPARLCGGVRRCLGGADSTRELLWLIAIRALYAGLMLTRTLAALWGGALLRLARQLASLAGEAPPRTIPRLAADRVDPRCAAPGSVTAGLALIYLQHGDLERLSELSRLLREARAPWLLELVSMGSRAAASTPLDRDRFALFAVLCDDCAGSAALPLDQLYIDVGTYDAAIRCPRCGALPAHPLPGVKIGEPHPVGRCLPGAGPAARTCITHDGGELDGEGLCVDGRATFDQAVVEASKIGRASTAFERDLVQSLVRARRHALNAKVDDAALARSLVTSPALMPFFAALAASDPDAGRDLARIAGAPLDPDAADPGVRAAMSGGGLAGLIATGKAALESLRDSLFRKPAALGPPHQRRRRRRHKESA